MVPLLDANVLIAVTVREHEHHGRASTWLAAQTGFAVCATVEGALVRFLVRLGESASTAQSLIAGVHAAERCEFWAESPSYIDIDLHAVRGHRQVTDAYLVDIAARRGGVVATLDQALAAQYPEASVLVPR